MELAKRSISPRIAREQKHELSSEFEKDIAYYCNRDFVLFYKDFPIEPLSVDSISRLKGMPLKDKQSVLGWWDKDSFTLLPAFLVTLAENIDQLYQKWLPIIYNGHKEKVESYNKRYFIGNSIFTSVVINEQYDVGPHFDANTLDGTIEAMFTVKSGSEGGYLNFFEYEKTLKNDNGNLVFFDGKNNMHGVTHIPDGQKRYTLLFLTNERLGE